MRRVAVINAMKSRRPTGIGVAGDAIPTLLPDRVALTSPRLDRWFVWINDAVRPPLLRMLLRIGLVQVAPWFFPRECLLVFTSHHAPLWRTGRHAVIVYDLIALRVPRHTRAQGFYFARMLPRVVRVATRVVTISEVMRGELRAVFLRLPPRKIAVIQSYSKALDRTEEEGDTVQARRERGELLVVGARYPHKNLSLLLRALEAIDEGSVLDRMSLVVAGCTRSLWAGLDRLEAAGCVRVIERPSDDEIVALYRSSLALVYPSLVEGQGLPPLEAMAHGCPVICADIPVLRETCGAAAFYIDPHNPAALIALSEAMLRGECDADIARQRHAACAQLAHFSKERLRKRWAAFIEDFR